MKLAIVCTGDELLKGSTINTNLAFMGSKLLELGILPEFAMEVRDDCSSIVSGVLSALEKADVVITSGGLGPTADDVTKDYLAREFACPLEPDADSAANILSYWKSRHGAETMPPRILNQSLVPHGAEVFPNRCGTAPGLALTVPREHRFAGKLVIMLPGPPNELEPMFLDSALPLLRSRLKSKLFSRTFYVCGPGESNVEDRMQPILARHQPLSAAYCASPGMVKLFLTSENEDVLSSACDDVRSVFASELLSHDNASLPEEIVQLLRAEHATLATAESCTGGLIAKSVTDIAGCSDVFLGTVVSYANEVKEHLLNVPRETLETVGAVSRETALAMVKGVLAQFGADAVITTTGIAGPGGGTAAKPVGLVYVGIAWRGRIAVHELHLRRTREQIRARAAAAAFNLLRRMIKGID